MIRWNMPYCTVKNCVHHIKNDTCKYSLAYLYQNEYLSTDDVSADEPCGNFKERAVKTEW